LEPIWRKNLSNNCLKIVGPADCAEALKSYYPATSSWSAEILTTPGAATLKTRTTLSEGEKFLHRHWQ